MLDKVSAILRMKETWIMNQKWTVKLSFRNLDHEGFKLSSEKERLNG